MFIFKVFLDVWEKVKTEGAILLNVWLTVFFILQIFYLLEWLFHRSGRPCILLCHLCVPVKWGDDESVLYLWNISKVIEPRWPIKHLSQRRVLSIDSEESGSLRSLVWFQIVDPNGVVSKTKSKHALSILAVIVAVDWVALSQLCVSSLTMER